MRMLYVVSPSTDPFFNLALEEHLFETLGQKQPFFMLWQNDNTVVVGKYQNTVTEIDPDYVRDHKVRVVRRLSGGGAVYHDLGNLNFTFVTDAKDSDTLDFQIFCKPVLETLAKLGVRAELNGRNDITIAGKKFSGNAQYRKKDHVMHHGTIMFDSDLDRIPRVLRVSKDKIESKSIRSVRSRVTNVREHLPRDITLEEFRQSLVQSVLGQSPLRYDLTSDDLHEAKRLSSERYAAWDWNYGCSPKYSIRKARRIENFGTIELYLNVNNGMIEGFQTFGDYFGSGDASDVAAALLGCKIRADDVFSSLEKLDISQYYYNMTADLLTQIICS